MNNSEFYKSWTAFAQVVDAANAEDNMDGERADIEHLKGLGAHEELIHSAQHRFLVDEFNIAPDEKTRDYTPDWMFKNAMTIGGDGCGNYAIWMDVTRMDSPILFICHDPQEITVLAKTPADFFDKIKVYVKSHGRDENFGLLYGYLETFNPEPNVTSGIIHQNKSDRDVFDFNAANIGDSIPLDFRGKYTIISKPPKPGLLVLKTESEDVIKKTNRNDRLALAVFLGSLSLVFLFFYSVRSKTLLASLGYTFLSFCMFVGVLQISMDAYYSWREKRKAKDR